MTLLRSSTKRPQPLKDIDCDHEINLVDHSRGNRNGSQSSLQNPPARASIISASSTPTRTTGDTGPLHKSGSSLRQDRSRRKWTKHRVSFQTDSTDSRRTSELGDTSLEEIDEAQNHTDAEPPRDSCATDTAADQPDSDQAESVIDILFENERGGFLCGIPLFSAKALGNLDPAAWTTRFGKASATNPSNAQVPDPSWRWAWKDWSINKEDDVDEDGWQYSFAFSKKFSWHSGRWWNSFVRRRAWTRKRVKKPPRQAEREVSVLSAAYFSVHSAHDEHATQQRTSGNDAASDHRDLKELVLKEIEDDLVKDGISDITRLMDVLRFSRIDRQKMEAVESFIKHGEDDLLHLETRMHDIMRSFVFQASRRLLLAHLIRILEDETETARNSPSTKKTDKVTSLQNAVSKAEDEVKKLEYWSDVKDLAEDGQTQGAVDGRQGSNDASWAGIDSSGPRDLTLLPGQEACVKQIGDTCQS